APAPGGSPTPARGDGASPHAAEPPPPYPGPAPDAEALALMDRIARESMAAYRRLVDDDAFWPLYQAVTPIEHISRLPRASRPPSRAAREGQVALDDLRAIPWVFAWTQVRYVAPGWFGGGAALEAVLREGGPE